MELYSPMRIQDFPTENKRVDTRNPVFRIVHYRKVYEILDFGSHSRTSHKGYKEAQAAVENAQ